MPSTLDGQQRFQAENTDVQAGPPLLKCSANALSHPVQTIDHCGCNRVGRCGAISHGALVYAIRVVAAFITSGFADSSHSAAGRSQRRERRCAQALLLGAWGARKT